MRCFETRAISRSFPIFVPFSFSFSLSFSIFALRCADVPSAQLKGINYVSPLHLSPSSLFFTFSHSFTSLHSSTTRTLSQQHSQPPRLVQADNMRYSTTSLFFSSLSLFTLATFSIASPIFKRGVNEGGGGVSEYEGGMNGLSGLGDSELPSLSFL